MKNFLLGLSFAMLWATAGTANKFGLVYGQPLWMTNSRFLIAALLLLLFVHGIQRAKLPQATEWKPLLIYGVLNNALYMSLFIYGLQKSSAGISTLALALNPLLINLLSSFWLKKDIAKNIWIGIALGMCGVATATYPLLKVGNVTTEGMSFLLASMVCYSIGTIYFSAQTWSLPKLTINAWQITFGAICMLPITLLFSNSKETIYNTQYCMAVAWLILPVTIIAVQLWLNLLSIDARKASFWLFTCPVFGFFYAYCLLNEPITIFTVIGTVFVIAGLYIGNLSKQI